jgi:hypothetical protein
MRIHFPRVFALASDPSLTLDAVRGLDLPDWRSQAGKTRKNAAWRGTI